jgi:hypothetical protein
MSTICKKLNCHFKVGARKKLIYEEIERFSGCKRPAL